MLGSGARREGSTSPRVGGSGGGRHLLPRLLGQVVALELALALVVATWPAGLPTRVTGVVVAVFVVASSLGRWQRRWCFAWYDVVARYWWRNRSSARSTTPAARVESFYDRAGTGFGMIEEGGSVTVVLALEPARPDLADCPDDELALALSPLLTFAGGRDVRPAELRLVTRVVGAPTARGDGRSRPAVSYREVAPGQPVAQRSVWVCLRLDPAWCPEAVAARGGGAEGARRALASLAARLAAAVEPPLRLRALGLEEVRALHRSMPDLSGEAVERFTGVEADGTYRGYRVDSWGGTDLPALVRAVAGTGALVVQASVSLRPLPADRWTARAVLVAHCPSGAVERVDREVRARAAASGARLQVLHGEHRLAVAETLPTSGARWPAVTARDGSIPVDGEVATRLRLEAQRGGLLVGRDGDGPVELSLFRDRPTSVATAMDPRVVAVLCFRAVAIGARVVVASDRSEPWETLRRLCDDWPEPPEMVGAGGWSLVTERPSADRPLLVVLDQVSGGEPVPVPPASWQCVVRVLPDASLRSVSGVGDSMVTVLQRLDAQDAVALAPLLGLTGEASGRLALLAEDELGVVERGSLRVLRWELSLVEAQLVAQATARSGRSAAGAAQA